MIQSNTDFTVPTSLDVDLMQYPVSQSERREEQWMTLVLFLFLGEQFYREIALELAAFYNK